jgi:protein-L-isoaspartate(D-aspartate) O-methyltransferase
MQHDARCATMIMDIEAEYKFTCGITGKCVFPQRIKTAMQQVPRHEFVPQSMQHSAYMNSPLPIGHGQTISQPFIVALMTDLLGTNENHAILEIGTGCGYQAAVLDRLVKKVYSLEIVSALATEAKERLRRLGYNNVEVREGDGYYGWREFAPFDGIIVTAATPEVPEELIDQLKVGGKLVLPVGYPYDRQELVVVSRGENGSIRQEDVLAVSFVPMTGGLGRAERKTVQ